ncbi:hypothetical protein SPHINGOR109_70069 [Sphingorhabdus sp. 109]|nr:hypothetical protein SPHINGOR109_70069 [Sphingorhabdus sp. 109]
MPICHPECRFLLGRHLFSHFLFSYRRVNRALRTYSEHMLFHVSQAKVIFHDQYFSNTPARIRLSHSSSYSASLCNGCLCRRGQYL